MHSPTFLPIDRLNYRGTIKVSGDYRFAAVRCTPSLLCDDLFRLFHTLTFGIHAMRNFRSTSSGGIGRPNNYLSDIEADLDVARK